MKYLRHIFLSSLLFLSQVALALPEGVVNVNTAAPEALASALDGVGSSKAIAIVEYREEYGEFVSIEDLLDVRGIGPKVIETNRKKIALTD